MTLQISGSMLGFFWYVLVSILADSLIGTVLEVLIPGEKQSWTSWLRALPNWASYIVIGLSVSAAILMIGASYPTISTALSRRWLFRISTEIKMPYENFAFI